jgi:hypothetical protein
MEEWDFVLRVRSNYNLTNVAMNWNACRLKMTYEKRTAVKKKERKREIILQPKQKMAKGEVPFLSALGGIGARRRFQHWFYLQFPFPYSNRISLVAYCPLCVLFLLVSVDKVNELIRSGWAGGIHWVSGCQSVQSP